MMAVNARMSRRFIEISSKESGIHVPELKEKISPLSDNIRCKRFVLLPNIGNFTKQMIDMRTTSVALGTYFEDFIKAKISQGRYNNASEVIRAGLRLLEENEERIMALKAAIDEGLESGVADGFDPRQHLKTLKAARANG